LKIRVATVLTGAFVARRNLLITQLFRQAQAKGGSQRLGQKRVEPFRGCLGLDALELVIADGQLFFPLFTWNS